MYQNIVSTVVDRELALQPDHKYLESPYAGHSGMNSEFIRMAIKQANREVALARAERARQAK